MNQPILKSLMIAFSVVVSKIFTNSKPEVIFPEENDSVQTILLDGNQIPTILQHTIVTVGDRSGDLFHPKTVWRLPNAAKLNAPRGKFDKEQDHETLKTGLCPNLDREEVSSHDLIPMAIEEFFPGGFRFPFG